MSDSLTDEPLGGATRGPQPCPRGDHVIATNRVRRKVALRDCEQIVHVRQGGRDFARIPFVVGVGGAEVGSVTPGEREEHSVIDRVKASDRDA